MKQFTYQWTRDGVDIPGATKYSYVVGVEDVGCTLSRRSDYIGSHSEKDVEFLIMKWRNTNASD